MRAAAPSLLFENNDTLSAGWRCLQFAGRVAVRAAIHGGHSRRVYPDGTLEAHSSRHGGQRTSAFRVDEAGLRRGGSPRTSGCNRI